MQNLRREAVRCCGLVVLALLGTALGCPAGRIEYVEPPTEQYLNTLMGAYLRYCEKNSRPPKNTNDLLTTLKEWGENPEKFLVSPNDGQEFVIVWEVDARFTENRDGIHPILIYERIGKNGKRFVHRIRDVVELDEQQFKQAFFPPGYTPET